MVTGPGACSAVCRRKGRVRAEDREAVARSQGVFMFSELLALICSGFSRHARCRLLLKGYAPVSPVSNAGPDTKPRASAPRRFSPSDVDPLGRRAACRRSESQLVVARGAALCDLPMNIPRPRPARRSSRPISSAGSPRHLDGSAAGCRLQAREIANSPRAARGLPDDLPQIRMRSKLLSMSRSGPSGARVGTRGATRRCWPASPLKVLLRKRLKLLFTSAAQRGTTPYTLG